MSVSDTPSGTRPADGQHGVECDRMVMAPGRITAADRTSGKSATEPQACGGEIAHEAQRQGADPACVMAGFRKSRDLAIEYVAQRNRIALPQSLGTAARYKKTECRDHASEAQFRDRAQPEGLIGVQCCEGIARGKGGKGQRHGLNNAAGYD